MTPHNVAALANIPRPFLITFSGIDGAGKTTQIEQLSSNLRAQGLRVLQLSFWDDVAVWSNMRAGVGHRTVASRYAQWTTEHSISPKNNKHIRTWYLTVSRAAFYLLDVVRLRRLLARQDIKNFDVIIFDRFIYDQLANIYSKSLAVRTYGKLLLKLTPVPELAILLDAAPTAAFARKPEYPLEFIRRNRQAFLRLRELAPQLTVVSSEQIDDVTAEISVHIGETRLAARTSIRKETDFRKESTVVRLQNYPTVRK